MQPDMPWRNAGRFFDAVGWGTQDRQKTSDASAANDVRRQCNDGQDMSNDVYRCADAVHEAVMVGGEVRDREQEWQVRVDAWLPCDTCSREGLAAFRALVLHVFCHSCRSRKTAFEVKQLCLMHQ